MLSIMRTINVTWSLYLVVTPSLLAAESLAKVAPQDLYFQSALQAAKDVKAAKSESLSLGIWVERRGRHIYVRDFYVGSPAAKAGLKRGDQILAVDGRDDQVMNSLMQLPHGTAVTIEYRRLPWSTPEKIKIHPKRESLHAAWMASTRESVSWFPLERGGRVAYMRSWGATDHEQIAVAKETYASILRKDPEAVVIDLRGPQPYDRSDLCEDMKQAFTAKAPKIVVIIDRKSGLCRLETALHLRNTQQAKVVGEPGPLQPNIPITDQLIFAAGHDSLLRAALIALEVRSPPAKD